MPIYFDYQSSNPPTTDQKWTSRGPKLTLEGLNLTPSGQKVDGKMPTIDSQWPISDSQSAKPTRRPKSTPRGQKESSVVQKSTISCLDLNPMTQCWDLKIDHPQRPKLIPRGINSTLGSQNSTSSGSESPPRGKNRLLEAHNNSLGIKFNWQLLKIYSPRHKADFHS